jgi:hypothetical protein
VIGRRVASRDALRRRAALGWGGRELSGCAGPGCRSRIPAWSFCAGRGASKPHRCVGRGGGRKAVQSNQRLSAVVRPARPRSMGDGQGGRTTADRRLTFARLLPQHWIHGGPSCPRLFRPRSARRFGNAANKAKRPRTSPAPWNCPPAACAICCSAAARRASTPCNSTTTPAGCAGMRTMPSSSAAPSNCAPTIRAGARAGCACS